MICDFQYPENYIPAVSNDSKSKLPASKKKRTLQDADLEDNEQCKSNDPKRNSLEKEATVNPEKKSKILYKLEKEAETLIKADVANKKYWEDCKEFLEKGKKVCVLQYLWLILKRFLLAVVIYRMWSTCRRLVFTLVYDL